jgi:cytidine deaminase
MSIFASERRVVAAAERLAATLDGHPTHTVAAAAMDVSGGIYTAVNVYHFTGGPCAELVVLGAAAAAKAGPLVTIAAAGDRGRGLIAPCGRCRQVLLDLHPDVLVAIPADGGPLVRPVRKLLPDAFLHPDSVARRIVRFNKRYYEPIVAGRKTSTIRYDDPIAPGPAIFYFEDDEACRTLSGTVTGTERHPLDKLTAVQAQGLRSHYPGLPSDADVDVVTFTVEVQPITGSS